MVIWGGHSVLTLVMLNILCTTLLHNFNLISLQHLSCKRILFNQWNTVWILI